METEILLSIAIAHFLDEMLLNVVEPSLDGDTVKDEESSKLRQSSYNIIIPVSSQICESDTPLYVVANPLYGTASLIDEREYKILTDFPRRYEESVVSDLKDDGYITHLTREEEKTLMESKYEAEKKAFDPRAGIAVTYQCNLRCTYCWTDFLFEQETTAHKVIDERTVDAAFAAIDHIPALQSLRALSLYGGECFLPSTKSAVEYILKKGSEKGYLFHANTNGYYLKEFLPLLTQYDIQGLGITLDGPPSVHDKRRIKQDGSGTFHRIVKAIDAALDEGISIDVRTNVDGDNIFHLPDFREWIEEHGWLHRKGISFSVSLVRPGIQNSPPACLTYAEAAQDIIDLSRERPFLFKTMPYEWEYMYKGYLYRTIVDGTELKPRPFYCYALYQGFVFDPFGDIYSCPRGVGDRTFSIGRFIPELRFNEKREQWSNRDVLSIPKCKACDLALVCGGGCAYEAYMGCNTIYEGYCEKYKAFLEYGMPFFIKWKMESQEL
ncbi:MAG: hypothetical protein AYK18_12975 [Theionarchaea archaeon DG-70]|nr:MAG: hypothetical protein AYK18_12975 [Theionarchaea archaeon DG-70]